MRPVRRRSLPWWAAAAAVLADACWLRRRATALPALLDVGSAAEDGSADGSAEDADAGGDGSAGDVDAGWVWVSGPPPVAVRTAAVRWAAAHGAEAVDVLVASSPARVMARLRWARPALRPDAVLLRPTTHPEVLGLHPSLVQRLRDGDGFADSPLAVSQRARAFGPSRYRMVAVPASAMAGTAPTRRGTAPAEAWAEARARFGPLAPASLVAPLAGVAALATGTVLAPAAAGAALAAWQMAPIVALTGTALDDRVAGPRRRLRGWSDGAGTALGALGEGSRRRWRAVPEATAGAASDDGAYAALHGDATALAEPRRHHCPLCGGGDLRRVLSSPDMLQGKPGRFHLERCGDCGHVFQNPRCTEAALDLYYRDFYDGRGADLADLLFATTDAVYRQRAAMVEGDPPPARWLDVGCGLGHFAAVARSVAPGTRFEGVDVGAGVVEGARRGWLDAAHRGRLPDLAGSLTAGFDVVSLFHSLEHARDPLAELRAAATVLVPGGRLLVELPNPECAAARRFGRHWLPWFQPQHQHLPPRPALCRLLDDLGFVVERAWTVPDPISLDAVTALALWLHRAAPPPDLPWAPAGGRGTVGPRLRRLAAYAALVAAAPAALLVDQLLAAVTPASRRAAAYRVVARWPGTREAAAEAAAAGDAAGKAAAGAAAAAGVAAAGAASGGGDRP